MTRTYLFAGASSAIAIHTALQLKAQGHRVIGISTKTENQGYDHFLTVPNYQFGSFPAIEEPIDALVYFPGTIQLKPFHRLSEQDFTNDYQINSLGAVAFVQAYLAKLKQSNAGSIVFISSVAARTGMPFHASIAMAKGAIESLTLSLAAELAPGIRVNCIAPSLTNTPLSDKFINTPEKIEASQKRNPMHKIGSTEDIAQAIMYLSSPGAAWITGQVLAVDGGMGVLKD